MQVNHLHFGSPNVDATRGFYERYFGFRHHSNLRETVVLVGDSHFLLAIDPLVEAAAPTRLHFGFCVGDSAKVRTLYAKMKDEGVSFSQELKEISENAVNFYCVDPAGNCVEVGWYKPLLPK